MRSASARTGSTAGSSAARPSSRSRMAVNGLASWCETSAIRSRCWLREYSTARAISSKDVANRRSSGGPACSAAPGRRPLASVCTRSVSWSTGRTTHATNGTPTRNATSASRAIPPATATASRVATSPRGPAVSTTITTAPRICASRPMGVATISGSVRQGHNADGAVVGVPVRARCTASSYRGSDRTGASAPNARVLPSGPMTALRVLPVTASYRARSGPSRAGAPDAESSTSAANRVAAARRCSCSVTARSSAYAVTSGAISAVRTAAVNVIARISSRRLIPVSYSSRLGPPSPRVGIRRPAPTPPPRGHAVSRAATPRVRRGCATRPPTSCPTPPP